MNKNNKHQQVVTNKIVKEKIKFQGKTIIREKIVKEFNIPKVITSDIGMQLMFGFSNLPKPSKEYYAKVYYLDKNEL